MKSLKHTAQIYSVDQFARSVSRTAATIPQPLRYYVMSALQLFRIETVVKATSEKGILEDTKIGLPPTTRQK